MATTHSLTADTRMEDLPGLASGDTIALCGHVLTCESNLSAITGLYATGTGTIRLLDGGNCDFSGSNPLPATVTIEGGTEDNPLPAHGDYGYIARAVAVISIRGHFSGQIVSHCVGNSDRSQFAMVAGSASGHIYLDRNVDWGAGDWLGVGRNQLEGSGKPIIIDAYDPATNRIDYSVGNTPPVGEPVMLYTTGMVCLCSQEISPHIIGDELGLSLWNGEGNPSLENAELHLGRLVALYPISNNQSFRRQLIGEFCAGYIGIASSIAWAVGYRNQSKHICGPLEIGAVYTRCCAASPLVKINGGFVSLNLRTYP